MDKKIWLALSVLVVVLAATWGVLKYDKKLKNEATLEEIQLLKNNELPALSLPDELEPYIERKEFDFVNEKSEEVTKDYNVYLYVKETFTELSNSKMYILIDVANSMLQRSDYSGCKNYDGQYMGCDFKRLFVVAGEDTFYTEENELFKNNEQLSLDDDETEEAEQPAEVTPPIEQLSAATKAYHESFYIHLYAGNSHIQAMSESFIDGYISEALIEDSIGYLTEFNDVLASYNPPTPETSKDQRLKDNTLLLIKQQKQANDALLDFIKTADTNALEKSLPYLKEAVNLYRIGKNMGL